MIEMLFRHRMEYLDILMAGIFKTINYYYYENYYKRRTGEDIRIMAHLIICSTALFILHFVSKV